MARLGQYILLAILAGLVYWSGILNIFEGEYFYPILGGIIGAALLTAIGGTIYAVVKKRNKDSGSDDSSALL